MSDLLFFDCMSHVFFNFYISSLQIVEIMLQQCKKHDIGYKSVAIATTGEVVESLEVDVFGELFSIISPLVHQVGTISTYYSN